MKGWQHHLYRVADRIRVWRGYTRAKLLALQGAKIGRRVAVDADCRIDRPWGVTIGERSRLERGVWLKLVSDGARVQIGNFSFVGAGTEFDISNCIVIGHHTVVAPGCFMTDHDHGTAADRRIDEQPSVSAPIRIGSDVWIGARVCILRGVTIGDGVVIGAGAVVKHDVSPYDVVAGVPAKLIRNRSATGLGKLPSTMDLS
jgi:acetyltransferase-like isoleucine patch superfamily enzyme